jgi:NAD+ kinase
VRYFVISKDADRQSEWEQRLRDQGFDVLDEYESDAIIVTLGGDGTILYAARTCEQPTILPVRIGDSKGLKTQIENEQVIETLDRLDSAGEDAIRSTTDWQTIAAYRDGEQLQGGFDALNEISLHHNSPTLGAVFSIEVRDGDPIYQADRVIGDGVLVATPFGSTAYYKSITGGTFTYGFGIAFNNVHTPVETPTAIQVSTDAVVELEIRESEHASGAVLTRDNAPEMYELSVGETIEIRRAPEVVTIIEPVTASE